MAPSAVLGSASATAERVRGIKPVPAAVQLLDKQLQNVDPGIRQAGLDGIPTLKSPAEPLSDCLGRLLDHENWYVRDTASLGVVKEAQCPGASESAVKDVAGKRLESADDYTRTCAARALVGIVSTHLSPAEDAADSEPGVPAPVATLAASEVALRLQHSDPTICRDAVECLAQMGSMAAPYAAAMAACLGSPDHGVRNAVIRAFRRLGVSAADGAEEAGRLLASPDAALRRVACRALVALSEHSGAAAAAGAASVLRHEDPVARRSAASCLADLGPLAAPWAKSLAARLEDEDAAVRVAAVRALVSAGPQMAQHLKHVSYRTQSEDPEIQRVAIDAMRGLARVSPPYARYASKLLHEDSPVQEQVKGLAILGGAGENAQPYLSDVVETLERPDWVIRRKAIEALQDLGEHAAPVAGQVARRMLHQQPYARRAAAEALGLMGVHSSGFGDRIVGAHATEDDPDVKRTCQEAMQTLRELGVLAAASAQSQRTVTAQSQRVVAQH